jgi:hypothetical protein
MPETKDVPAATPAARELRRLAWLLDDSIRLPGGYRIGLDGIVGLIPGLGDAAGLAASTYILFRARRFGIPRVVMARMIGNVLLESLIGVIPILGDLFDFAFKANRRNIALMERYFVDERQVRRSSWGRLLLAAAVGLMLVVLILFLTFRLIQWIANIASG